MTFHGLRRCHLCVSFLLLIASATAYGGSVFLSSPNQPVGGASELLPTEKGIARVYADHEYALGELDRTFSEFFPPRLNTTTKITHGSPSSLLAAINRVNGEAAESMMHMYYAEQGWKPIDRAGPQGIDGLFYRVERNGRLRVLIAESKSGTSKLGKTLTKGHQMSHEWILKSLDEQIRKHQRSLLSETTKERAAIDEQIRLLKRIRKYVQYRDYRSELFQSNVKNGVLQVNFSRLNQTRGGEAPLIDRSKVSTRKVDLAHPEKLKRSDLKIYNTYFDSKKQELLKRMGEGAAQRAIDDLKIQYIQSPSMGTREERAFLQMCLEQHEARKIELAVMRQASRVVQRLPAGWQNTARTVLKKGAGAAGKTYAVRGRVLSRGLFIVDISTNVYLTYGDYLKWRSGEIDGEYLGFKAGLRSVQSALALYALVAPDVTFVTKFATGTAAALLMGVDLVSDPFYEAARDRRRELLVRVDQDARFDMCRIGLETKVASVMAES